MKQRSSAQCSKAARLFTERIHKKFNQAHRQFTVSLWLLPLLTFVATFLAFLTPNDNNKKINDKEL